MLLFSLILASISAGLSVQSGGLDRDVLPGPILAEVVEVVDGDTVGVRAYIWPGHSVITRVRLAEIDTPELRRPDCEAERELGHIARDFVRDLMTSGDLITLHNVELGSFAGRVVAGIHLSDERDLATLLTEAGLAQPYGRSDFCLE